MYYLDLEYTEYTTHETHNQPVDIFTQGTHRTQPVHTEYTGITLTTSGHEKDSRDAILAGAAQFEKHNPTKSKQAPNPTNKTN